MRQLIIQISIKKFIYCDGHFYCFSYTFLSFPKYYIFNSYRTLDLVLYTRKNQTHYSEQGNSKAWSLGRLTKFFTAN